MTNFIAVGSNLWKWKWHQINCAQELQQLSLNYRNLQTRRKTINEINLVN